jgi:hypothetical protein
MDTGCAAMRVEEIIAVLLELDQGSDGYFLRNNNDQLVYIVAELDGNRVCTSLPTAIDKRDIEPQGETE